MFITNGEYVDLEKQRDDSAIRIVVTSAKINDVEQENDYRLVLPKGATTVLELELQDKDGNVLPVTDSFAVPLGILMGPVADTFLIEFMDGMATFTETWETSGEFVISEELLNLYIPEGTYFKFEGLAFSVYR